MEGLYTMTVSVHVALGGGCPSHVAGSMTT